MKHKSHIFPLLYLCVWNENPLRSLIGKNPSPHY